VLGGVHKEQLNQILIKSYNMGEACRTNKVKNTRSFELWKSDAGIKAEMSRENNMDIHTVTHPVAGRVRLNSLMKV
jgi:hypothetical protein